MCTRVVWNDNGQAVLVGRNMDWMQDLGTNLWSLPRGGTRQGLADGSGLEWPVHYGSVVATAHDFATTDGVNERGLAAQLLWLAETDFGVRDMAVPGITAALWAQMFLDTCATVAECAALMRTTNWQVRPVVEPHSGQTSTVHLALDDASGDSMIIEYVDGVPNVYHNRSLAVMTNSPPYPDQLELLGHYEGLGGDTPLPGTTDAPDRFVRASYYLSHLPEPANWREAMAGLASVMRNAAQPFGAPDPAHPEISSTIWRTFADLTNRQYFFESSHSPYLVWVSVDELDLDQGAKPARLDLHADRDLQGDVANMFVPTAAFDFMMPAPETAHRS